MTVVAGKRRRRASDAEVQRLNIFINPDAHRRLMVHSVMSGLSPGLFIEKLIFDHCRTWKVQVNPHGKSKEEDRPNSADDVSQAEITAA
jgi:hypothetical protein